MMTNKNWRVTFLTLCIAANESAEFTPLECHFTEELYAKLRNDGNSAAQRFAGAAGGRCLELWNKYQEAMK
jgi:hypothetical protein